MYVKYDKTYHLLPVTSKHNLDKTTIQRLLAGEVIVEEKMDGANVGIIRHRKGFSLQKRGSLVGTSEHEQFGFFHNWANQQNYEKIMALPDNKNILIYGELLYAVHTIYYDTLPDYFLAFDVRMNGEWLDYDDRIAFCQKYGFLSVPLVNRGSFTKDQLASMIPQRSAYGEYAEGIVVKRYAKHGYFRAKLVKPDFIKALEESDHWMFKNVTRNKVVGS